MGENELAAKWLGQINWADQSGRVFLEGYVLDEYCGGDGLNAALHSYMPPSLPMATH
jgi:hypothetical protein